MFLTSNRTVKVDEWGAVIKNQNEAFKRMEEDKQRENMQLMKGYGKELESEVYNKLRKNKDSLNAEKTLEMQQALQKKAELDQINASNLNRKRQMQEALMKDYENSIRLKEQQKNYERRSDLQNGQLANNKAAQELDYLNQNEMSKRKMVKEILNNAKNVHDGVKGQSEKDRYVSTLEDRRHLEEIEQRSKERDMAMLSKFNQFNEFQNKTAFSYNQNVSRPLMEKDMKFREILRKQEQEAKRKADQDAEMRNTMRKKMAMETRFGLEKQMKTKNDNNQALVAQHNYEEQTTRTIERDLHNLKNQDFHEKKVRQQKYKEMLDNQKRLQGNMRMYGNMTGMEKQLNKNDLSAFKNYDNKTYALIPGLNSVSMPPSKKVMEDKLTKRNERSYDEQNERLNQFGLTRDVTLIKNPALYTTNAHRSSTNDITGHVNQNSSDMIQAPGHMRSASGTAPGKALTLPPNSPNPNFNNHHLYQTYNPISGTYSPDKQAMNQARTTFRYAAARNII